MEQLQRNLANHFKAGGTLEEAANKHKTWQTSMGKDALKMWQLGVSINEIEAEMKKRSCNGHDRGRVEQCLGRPKQKHS